MFKESPKENSMQFFQALLILGIAFLLGLSSTGLCNATYTDLDCNKRFTVRQQMSSETPTPEDGVMGNDGVVQYPQSEKPNTIKYNDFFLGTIGLHTLFEGTAFGGLTAYLGGRKTSKGFGVLGSYEVGALDIAGYDTLIQIVNISLSFSYKIGKSTILSSAGVTYVRGSAIDYDDMEVEVGGATASISYLYQPDNRFTLMVQGRLQGRGIMLSAGVGF